MTINRNTTDITPVRLIQSALRVRHLQIHPLPQSPTLKPCDQHKASCSGAGNETRTRDPNLGKVVLYQLSYSRSSHPALGEIDSMQQENTVNR